MQRSANMKLTTQPKPKDRRPPNVFYTHVCLALHTGAGVVGDEACALLFLCGAAVLLLLLLLFFFSMFVFGVRARAPGRWEVGTGRYSRRITQQTRTTGI